MQKKLQYFNTFSIGSCVYTFCHSQLFENIYDFDVGLNENEFETPFLRWARPANQRSPFSQLQYEQV